MIATSRSAAALVTAWFAFIVCGFGQVAPMPARGHPRLPGPATDGYIEQAPADRIQAHLATVAAWEPLTGQTRHGDIQAAVIITLGVEPRTINKLDAWMSSWDISRGIWPRGWAEDAAALAAAWIYDQCHSRAPPEMRQRWLRQCVLSLARLRAVWIQQRYSVFNSVTYNRAGAAPVWLALAAWPDAAPEFGTELFDWAVSVAAEYVEAWRLMLDGGGWPEGWTYWGQGGRAVYQVLAGIDAAYGAETVLSERYLRDSLRMREYLVEPDGTAVPFGDQHTHLITIGPSAWNSFEAYRETAYATRDPHALAYLGARDPLELPLFPWGHRRPLDAGDVPTPELPRHHHFRGAGVYALRDGWAGEDSTMVTILAGGDGVSHQKMDDGHFWIWQRGVLAADAGSYALGATSEQAYAYRSTGSWNTLRIFDPSDPSPDHTLRVVVGREGSRDIFEDVPLPADGGQKRIGSGFTSKPLTVSQWLARAEEFALGRVIAEKHEPELDDIRVDLTACYRGFGGGAPWQSRTDRVRRYERRFLWVRPAGLEVSVLVVADLVVLEDASHALQWVMHCREAAVQESPTLWRVERTSAVEYEFGVPRGLKYATTDRRYRYAGRAWVEALLPEGMSGGARSDWSHVGGRPYTRGQISAYKSRPTWHPTDPTKGPAEAAGFRLELDYAPTGQRARVLAHAISIGAYVPATIATHADGVTISFPSIGRTLHLGLDHESRLEQVR